MDSIIKPDLHSDEMGVSPPLDRSNPEADAVPSPTGKFIAVNPEGHHGAGQTKRRRQGHHLKGRRAIPGLIDSHMHIIRGG